MKNKKQKFFQYLFGCCIPLLLSSCTLNNPANNDETVTSLSFNFSSYSLKGLETFQLEIYDNNNNLLDFSSCVIQSSDTSVVTISDDGLVSALNVDGSTTITAYYGQNLSISATCVVSTTSVILLESIIPNVSNLNLIVGSDSTSITYSFSPQNADVTSINIYVEDESIASIDNMRVSGLKFGSTNIIIETDSYNNYVSTSITVNVYNNEEEMKTFLTETTDIDASLSYQELNQLADFGGIPSVTEGSETNVLVVPINFTDYSFSNQYQLTDTEVVNRLDAVFNGDGVDDTGYWESVSSFFYESSNGKLNLSFDIGEVYTSSLTATELINKPSSYNEDKNYSIFREVIASYESNGYDFNKYDNDGDGEIDSVWFIYSAPNNSNNSNLDDCENIFWAYVYYDYGNTVTTSGSDQPDFNKFAWASFDFLYSVNRANGYDTHTYIHETGHLLGLNDYYDGDGYSRAPLGILDMQDCNVGDHNTWSKASLGWVDPIVYDESSIEEDEVYVTITKDTPLFVTNEYHDTVFDEYIIFELYTPDGLNELDVTYNYGYGLMPNTTGVKVLHSDSRLIDSWYGSYNFVYSNYDSYDYLTIGSYNTPSYSVTGFDQLTMISSKIGGGSFLNRFTPWTADDLFYEEDVFNLETYKQNNTYNNSGKLNNGASLDVNITVEELGSDYAILSIEKI